MTPEYIHVTEIPGNKASAEQIERLYHRYHFASAFCQGKEVLEVACGAGMGLGYLAGTSTKNSWSWPKGTMRVGQILN
jgi:cyclopropane fatty-acyl-phospholipid synthase-like methyltransferase